MKLTLLTMAIAGLFAATGLATDLTIHPSTLQSSEDIPDWEVFEFVKDGPIDLESAGEEKALKIATDADGKGLILIAMDAVDCEGGGTFTFAFVAAGVGELDGAAYLLDASGNTIGGVYTTIKKLRSDDEWTDFYDEKDIPAEVDGNPVAAVRPFLKVIRDSNVMVKSVECKITQN